MSLTEVLHILIVEDFFIFTSLNSLVKRKGYITIIWYLLTNKPYIQKIE